MEYKRSSHLYRPRSEQPLLTTIETATHGNSGADPALYTMIDVYHYQELTAATAKPLPRLY